MTPIPPAAGKISASAAITPDGFPTRRHWPTLDGLRGSALLAVLVCHYSVLLPQSHNIPGILEMFWPGVDLFFVLSGFLITGILLDSRGSPHYFRNFYARRTLRIFPLYYAFLAVLLLASRQHAPNPLAPAWRYLWTYTANYWIGANSQPTPWRDIIIPLWSLSVEEQFYLLWPFVILLVTPRSGTASEKNPMSRMRFIPSPGGGGLGRGDFRIAKCAADSQTPPLPCLPPAGEGERFLLQALIRFCAATMFAVLLLRLVLTARHIDWFAIYTSTPTRIDPIAAGAALAALLRLPGGQVVARKFFHIAGPLAVVAMVLISPGFDPIHHPWLRDFLYTVLAVLFASLLFWSIDPAALRGIPARFYSHPLLRAVGRYSYGLYIVHLPLMYLTRSIATRHALYNPADPSWITAFTLIAMNVALAAIIAVASFHLFEKQFLRLKRFFPEHASINGEILSF